MFVPYIFYECFARRVGKHDELMFLYHCFFYFYYFFSHFLSTQVWSGWVAPHGSFHASLQQIWSAIDFGLMFFLYIQFFYCGYGPAELPPMFVHACLQQMLVYSKLLVVFAKQFFLLIKFLLTIISRSRTISLNLKYNYYNFNYNCNYNYYEWCLMSLFLVHSSLYLYLVLVCTPCAMTSVALSVSLIIVVSCLMNVWHQS